VSSKKHKKIRPNNVRNIFQYFSPFIKPHRGTISSAFLCLLGVTLMELLRPWPIKIIFDVLLVPQADTIHKIEKISPWLTDADLLLGLISGAILIIAVLTGLFGFGHSYLTSSVGQKVIASIRHHLYSHMQRLSHSFHDESSVGDLLARLTGDIRMMRELLVNSVIFVTDRSLALIGMIGIMCWMDWQLTLVALIIIPLLLLTIVSFNKKIKKATRKQRRKESQVTSILSEKLSAITLVQAFARESYEEDKFLKKNTSDMKAGLASTRLEAHQNRIVQIILAIGTSLVLWFGVKQVQNGFLTPGDLLVFTAYLSSLYKPIRKLSSLTSRIAKATVCGERIISILETEPDIQDSVDAIITPPVQGLINFKQVSFNYKNNKPVLTDTCFRILPKQTIALIGQSGTGKSTIIRLLLRFYDPTQGSIEIDGRDIRSYQLESLRQQISIVLQEPYLFNASIRDNISYGNLDASIEDIKNAARLANAHDFIEELAEGYDSFISERGTSLSGGQQQRIAIARAMIRKAPIVILDEPTSGLDLENKIDVEQALHKLTENKTCIFITHDRATAMMADKIFMIENEQVVEISKQAAEAIFNPAVEVNPVLKSY